VSRAGDTYYNDNNGRGSENITHRKNTAAGVLKPGAGKGWRRSREK
jgi:hypothetical protein